jgi:HD-GYP domain-containing protein (c-di-GMP phosphodiesterase class II)
VAILADALDAQGALLDRERRELACELHDIGKIGVSDSVLNKHGPLDDKEMAAVRQHPVVGRRILEPLLDDENPYTRLSAAHAILSIKSRAAETVGS